MQLTQITSELPLYSISDVFSSSICNQLNTIDWLSLPQINYGDSNRLNLILPNDLVQEINQHALDVLFPSIENCLKIKFVDSRLFSLLCWYNTANYQSGIHIDGTLPAGLQVYWEPSTSIDYGTCFYNSRNTGDLLHYFPSVQNTGYCALYKTAKQPLWHGTNFPLPENILRVSFMFVLSDYITL
jgi:hypothetical protein